VTRDGKTTSTAAVPLEIVGIIVERKPVRLGQSFVAGDDWMRGLKVRMKNVSGKTSLRATQSFSLPETKDKYVQGEFVVSLRYGKAAYVEAIGGDTDEEKQPAVMPGEEFELTWIDRIYERERQFVAQGSGVTEFSRATFGTASVSFEDGAQWVGYARPNYVQAKTQ
jgi:hypothetical protein